MRYLLRKGSRIIVDPDPKIIRRIELLIQDANPEEYQDLLRKKLYAVVFTLDSEKGLGVESLDTYEEYNRLLRIRKVVNN